MALPLDKAKEQGGMPLATHPQSHPSSSSSASVH